MKNPIEIHRPALALFAVLLGANLLFASIGQAQSGNEIIYNTKTETLEADRILLRYTQLWNLYRFRNDPVLTEEEKVRVDGLLTMTRIPYLHAEMPIDDIKETIKKNAVELRKLLRKEIASSETPHAAQANLEYLDKMVRGFASAGQYNKLNRRKFSEEFNRMLPAPEYQSTSGRNIISQ